MLAEVMGRLSAEVVICGAGIAGVATAYHLAVRRGVRGVVLVDERPPLTLTSDKSTECYRNWWPGPGDAMVAVMNRSIDLLEQLARESGNIFQLNRRGYLFATADPVRLRRLPRVGGSRRGCRPVPVLPRGCGGACEFVPMRYPDALTPRRSGAAAPGARPRAVAPPRP